MVERPELVDSEIFVTDFPVKRFHETVRSGLPSRNEDSFCFTSPLGNSVADELGPFIHVECFRGRATDGQQSE